jgi:hypothetical protein
MHIRRIRAVLDIARRVVVRAASNAANHSGSVVASPHTWLDGIDGIEELLPHNY